MTLLSPWWLLLVPTLYIVVILHTLHPQRNRVLVPSTLIWQRVLRELAADAKWRRIVANLLLLAQIAALTALIVALTRPAFLLPAARQRQVIFVLDCSASMAATDVVPNRLQAAKDALISQLRNNRPKHITIIEGSPQPVVTYDGPASITAIKLALRRSNPSDGGIDWNNVAVLARSSLVSEQGFVTIVSDGAIDTSAVHGLSDIMAKTPINLVTVGGHGVNVGITAFDARQAGDSLSHYEVLVTVANYSPATVQAPLILNNAKGEIGRRTVTIPPGEQRNVVFQHTFATQDTLHATLNYTDHLSLDNQAYLVAYPPTPTRVLLVGPGNYFLEKGLRVFPQVRLERRLLYPEGAEYPLVIFDRMPVPSNFTGTAVYLAGAESDRKLGVRSLPQVTWWDRSHPLTRFVSWTDLTLQQAFLLPRKEGAHVLVESESGPLIQLVENDSARILTFAFALEESDWPLKVAFPLFLSHLLQWAHPDGWEFVRKPLAPGDVMPLPYSLSDENGWTVRTPSGKLVHVAVGKGATFNNTLSVGPYAVVARNDEFPFAVNAGSPAESDIRPRLQLPSADSTAAAAKLRVPAGFFWPFAFFGLLLLIAEGWLYTHKIRRPANLGLPHWDELKLRWNQLISRRG